MLSLVSAASTSPARQVPAIRREHRGLPVLGRLLEFAADPTHGNEAYGEAMIRAIEDM